MKREYDDYDGDDDDLEDWFTGPDGDAETYIGEEQPHHLYATDFRRAVQREALRALSTNGGSNGCSNVQEDESIMSESGIDEPLGWWAGKDGSHVTVEPTYFANMIASAMDTIMNEDDARIRLRENIKKLEHHCVTLQPTGMAAPMTASVGGGDGNGSVMPPDRLMNLITEVCKDSRYLLETESVFRMMAGERITALMRHAHSIAPGNDILATSIHQLRGGRGGYK